MTSIMTPDEIKGYALPVTAKQWAMIGDVTLAAVSDYATQHLEDYMDRKIAVTNYIDRIRRGSGNEYQMLSVYPVVTVNSISRYDGFGNTYPYTVSTDFYVNNAAGIIEFVQSYRNSFTRTAKFQIDYTAGYTVVPGPIKHAVALQTVKMLQPLFRGGTSFTETELITELDEQILELLDYYKRRRIG